MTMRLDYALYGVAIILFILTAIILGTITNQNGGLIYGSLAAILGIIAIGCGYFLKPITAKTKLTIPTEVPKPKVPSPEPEQKTMTVPETSKTEIMIEEPKPLVVPPSRDETKIVTTSSEQTISAEISQTPQMSTPTVTAPIVLPEDETKTEECAVDARANGLAQIKCISSKRAEQLNSIGISSIEDLAKASSSELAAKLQVSEKIVKMWIGSARKVAK